MPTSPHKGMMIKHMVAARTPVTPGGINETTIPLSPKESGRNQAIQGFWNAMYTRGAHITRVVLPHDLPGEDGLEKSQRARQVEWDRQSSMPWGSNFMHTPTDAQRLNNPAMASAMKQRQLTIPSSYGQFYAFMHALSAAFGQLSNTQ